MKIAVIGMGKIGLPLAVQYARKGHDVIGVDINSKTIDLINKGIEPFPEEANLQDYMREVVTSRKLKATLSYEEAVSVADVIVVVVPLFVNNRAEPDFKSMDIATENIAKHLKKNSLICYETTLPIGTTRNRFTPELERITGMKVGQEFHVVFSPERVYTGRIFGDLQKYPKIVGGITRTCTQKGVDFYQQVLDFDVRTDLPKPNGVWDLGSAESAEFVKLAETTYRDVNIALANQFAKHSTELKLNIYEIIEAANSQKFSHIHKPGVGVGGHCIPVYPYFYLENDVQAELIKMARVTNESMPIWFVEWLEKRIGKLQDKIIAISGVSYRSNTNETYNSPAIEIQDKLRERNARVIAFDENLNNGKLKKLGFDTEIDKNLEILIHHSASKKYTLELAKKHNIKILVDTKNEIVENEVPYKTMLINLFS